MTVEEIKQQYSMRDVLSMYGLKPNRAGFCFCPFHNERGHESFKVYEKDYHCFGCGQNGDIFDFITKMDNCDFKTAFLRLGGEYEKKSAWERKRFEYEQQKKKEKAQKILEEKRMRKRQLIKDIPLQRLFTKCFPVFSDDWCDSVNKLNYELIELGELNSEGVKLYD